MDIFFSGWLRLRMAIESLHRRHDGAHLPLLRLAPALTALALLACGPGMPGHCIGCGPNVAKLGGTLSGLVGSNLILQNNGHPGSPISGPSANGSDVVFAHADYNSSYNLR